MQNIKESLVSVVIPTYNRFEYLLDAIESVQNQTYSNIEIIVVNDCSTQEQYYSFDFGSSVKIYHLPQNSKKIFGHPSGGYVRNYGCQMSSGKYIAFLDDDDIFLKNKIMDQVGMMEYLDIPFTCTNGYIGNGKYQSEKRYDKFLEHNHESVLKKFRQRNSEHLIVPKYPSVFTRKIIDVHNLIVTSSVMVNRQMFIEIGMFRHLPNGTEDYDAWKRILDRYKCYYLSSPYFYYNNSHGDGQNY
jgi:glycosyltransferase involved in cell wall biosynthesis